MGLILGPILSFLKLIPWWAYAIAACLAWGSYQRYQVKHVAAVYQEAQAEAAKERIVRNVGDGVGGRDTGQTDTV